MAATAAAAVAATSAAVAWAAAGHTLPPHLAATGTLQVWVHCAAAVVAAGLELTGMAIKATAACGRAKQLRGPQRSTDAPPAGSARSGIALQSSGAMPLQQMHAHTPVTLVSITSWNTWRDTWCAACSFPRMPAQSVG